MNQLVRFTRLQLAGWVLLVLPISMFLLETLDGIFRFLPHRPQHSAPDIGILFVIWFGIGLIRNNRSYRSSTRLLCTLYLLTFTALALFGPLQPRGQRVLTIYVPIVAPAVWHYFLVWLFALIFFGIPFYLLRPHPDATSQSARS